MFNPTKIWRKWHKKVNVNQKRFAIVSALAASASTSLVLARGHRIENVPHMPLVVEDALQAVKKTTAALKVLAKIGADADAQKAKDSKKVRAGVGKTRNRRYVLRRGPLIIYDGDSTKDKSLTKAFRNLQGVDLCRVSALNILQLAPGGHLGRFIIWTQSAFAKLDALYGTSTTKSALKVDYSLPRSIVSNADIARIINSDEVQSAVRPARSAAFKAPRRKNPLKNFQALVKLNPFALAQRRRELAQQKRQTAARDAKLAQLRSGEAVPADKKTKDARKKSKAGRADRLKFFAAAKAQGN